MLCRSTIFTCARGERFPPPLDLGRFERRDGVAAYGTGAFLFMGDIEPH